MISTSMYVSSPLILSISTRLRASDGPMTTTGSMVFAMDAMSSKGIRAVCVSLTTGSVLGESHSKERMPSLPTVIQTLSMYQETVSALVSSEQR